MLRTLALIVSCLLPISVLAHGLNPMRLYVPADTSVVIATFTAVNNYSDVDRFLVECFKHDLKRQVECESAPNQLVLAPHASRHFKVRLPTEGNDVYLICTKEYPAPNNPKPIVSRICARVGVGVIPIPNSKRKPGSNQYQ